MKLINTNLHGWLDYSMGAIVMGSPWIFGFHDIDIATYIALASGGIVILYSLLTNYEMGVLKRNGIPMKLHLLLDVVSGIFLAASPWLFNFSDITYNPFLFLGIMEVSTALLTDSIAYARLGASAVRDVDNIG